MGNGEQVVTEQFQRERHEWINKRRPVMVNTASLMVQTYLDMEKILTCDFDNAEGDGFNRDAVNAEVTLAKRKLQESLFWLKEGERVAREKIHATDIYFKSLPHQEQ
jgi:hypothetical protein